MKKLFFILILIFSSIIKVDATSVSSIDMDIYIENDGDAIVVETWEANINEGTEGYHPYYNLGNATISDLSVSMDGKEFTTVYDWDINDSFLEKSYKAGLYKASSNEIDICFGISSYGSHTYKIKYTINGFVVGLNDYDMVYWNLFPHKFSAKPDNVSISIRSYFKFNDTLDVWGYGKYGAPCYVYDGMIKMTSDGVVASDEYLTILVKLPKGKFNTNNIINNNFDYYYNMAEEGTVKYNNESLDSSDDSFDLTDNCLNFILNNFFFIIVFLVIVIGGFESLFEKIFRGAKYNFGTIGNKIRKDVPNFRDIPCNKDIYRAYWVVNNYGIYSRKEDFLGAVLLKWLKNGNVKIEKVEKSSFFKKTIENNIIFINKPNSSNFYEIDLYNWMYVASRDGKLESGEFKKWCKNNYSKILKWFDDILVYERDVLVNEGKINVIKKTRFKFFKSDDSYLVDESMMQEAEQLAGLKKYLKEFTLIEIREPIEVALWGEYLMYAQIFGIADEVAKQFKKLYPEIMDNMNSMGYNYDDFVFIYTISYDGVRSAITSKSRADSYSSGGGGFSSGGGGGGSFGGGGGGGGFR